MTNIVNTQRKTTPRIIVADADPDIRAMYRESLRIACAEVIEATDGREALVQALMQPPALVITELWLPILNGYELCAVLRRDLQTRSVPVFVVTGESRTSALEHAWDAGADLVFMKPLTPEALLREAQRFIGDAPTTTHRPPALMTMEQPALGRKAAKAQRRYPTTTRPPISPPQLICPLCDRRLTYERSHIGGVKRQQEQWDRYVCGGACGAYEYRQRTRTLRKVQSVSPSRSGSGEVRAAELD